MPVKEAKEEKVENYLKPQEFSAFASRLEVIFKEHFDSLHSRLVEFEEWARVSPAQVREIADKFRKYISKDHILRLIQYQRGRVLSDGTTLCAPEWHAKREVSLPASVVDKMPEKDYKDFCNDRPQDFMTANGVKRSRPSNSTTPDLKRGHSDTGERLPPEKQTHGIPGKPKNERTVRDFKKATGDLVAIRHKNGNAIYASIDDLKRVVRWFSTAEIDEVLD